MPSIKVLDQAGTPAPAEVANPIKLAILGYQHNKPFNRAVMSWRSILFPKDSEADLRIPARLRFQFPLQNPALARVW